MIKPTIEHSIAKGNILPKFRDQITLPSAVNLTGAVYTFRYQKPGASTVSRSASLVSVDEGTSTAATKFTLEWAPIAADTAAEGVFNYHWRIALSGESAPLDVPSEVNDDADGSKRQFQRFEVLPVL